METERQLLEAIHSGDRAALRRLYDRYAGYAMAVALRYTPEPDQARDVLQDSFVRILTAVSRFSYHGEGSLKAWVARIVSNCAINSLRQQQRFLLTDDLPDTPDEEEAPSLDDLSPDTLMRLIARLPDNYRTVLNLFVFERCSHRDIARLLSIKESTSSSLLFRARKALARLITQDLTIDAL